YGSTGTAYIRNNVIYDVTGAPFVWCFTVAGTVEVYYNTFHNGNEQGFHFSSTPSGITIKNNIFSEVDGDPIDSSSPTSDYNVRYNCGSCSDPGANDQTGDPRFVSVAQGSEDFHLLDTASSAYNTGVDVGITDDIEGIARPQGLAYDIGAYEYAASFEEILSSLGISVLSVQDLQFYIYVLLTTAILTSIIRDLQGYVDSLLSTGISVSAITDSVSGGSSGESGVYGGTIYGGAIN
ncbi:right-handed parallel beta-helix repeat-containing protein, partial [Patescibacteria group bacterium]|nr:right-handed parallel beta-helix repeat-containing protein [Patescibacteria group bacterium]